MKERTDTVGVNPGFFHHIKEGVEITKRLFLVGDHTFCVYAKKVFCRVLFIKIFHEADIICILFTEKDLVDNRGYKAGSILIRVNAVGEEVIPTLKRLREVNEGGVALFGRTRDKGVDLADSGGYAWHPRDWRGLRDKDLGTWRAPLERGYKVHVVFHEFFLEGGVDHLNGIIGAEADDDDIGPPSDSLVILHGSRIAVESVAPQTRSAHTEIADLVTDATSALAVAALVRHHLEDGRIALAFPVVQGQSVGDGITDAGYFYDFIFHLLPFRGDYLPETLFLTFSLPPVNTWPKTPMDTTSDFLPFLRTPLLKMKWFSTVRLLSRYRPETCEPMAASPPRRLETTKLPLSLELSSSLMFSLTTVRIASLWACLSGQVTTATPPTMRRARSALKSVFIVQLFS